MGVGLKRLKRYNSDSTRNIFRKLKPREETPSFQKIQEVWNAFYVKMRMSGFGIVNAKLIDDELTSNGLQKTEEKSGIIKRGEVIFNLGLGKKRSNFFVFAKISGENKDQLEIFYTNPQADEDSLSLPKDQIFIHRVVDGSLVGDIDNVVKNIVNEIKNYSKNKPVDDYRMQMHFHVHHIFQKYNPIADDGSSAMEDVLRKAILYHTDIFAPTPHNSWNKWMHGTLNTACEKLGITYVPGFELTMPLEGGPNGPHHVVLCASNSMGRKLRRDILDMRDSNLRMISYFKGMEIEEMYQILERYKKLGLVATFIAHPVSQENQILNIHAVGLFSVTEVWSGLGFGDIKKLDPIEAMNYAVRNNGIAAYNNTMDKGELTISHISKTSWLYETIKNGIRKLKLGRVEVTPNIGNLVFAQKLKPFIHNTHFESDEHTTTPMDRYIAGGDGFGAGFTKVELPERILRGLKSETKKLDSYLFVKGINNGSITLSHFVYSDVINGKLVIVPQRAELDPRMKPERNRLRMEQARNYIRQLRKDALRFIVEGGFKRLFNMDK